MSAGTTAAITPPPAPIAPTAANWADPENANAERPTTVVAASPPKQSLAAINAEVADASRGATLEFDGEGFVARPPETDAFLPLHLVARALADLLTSPRLSRVGRCDGVGDCGWLFLDATKNHSRRWCSMAGCGSRAKMRRYYARRKGSAGSASRSSAA
jgi:predicted RNA-binding Zn ribbon-like protein